MLKIILLGILRVFMALIPIVIEGSYGKNWLVCLVELVIVHRVDFNVSRFLSERSGKAYSVQMVES